MSFPRLRSYAHRLGRAIEALPPLNRELKAAITGRLGTDGGGVIALIVAARDDPLTRQVRRAFPKAKVHELAQTGSDRHVRLTTLRPIDVIVDARGPSRRAERFLDEFYQLRDGGVLIATMGAPEARDHHEDSLGALLASAAAARNKPAPTKTRGVPRATLDAHALGTALGTVEAAGLHLVLERTGPDARAKLREPEMNAYLAARPYERDRVLEIIPAQPFRSRCELRENASPGRPNYPDRYDTIDLSLRLYHDAVVSPAQVLATEDVITPDSYRHNQFPRLGNRATIEMAPRFARLKHPTDDLPYLPGTYYHLDNEFRGHYGHLMTEQISRLWAWPHAKARYPDLKAVVAVNKGRQLADWESRIYAAGGIAPKDLVFLEGPARVERITSATPMLSNPNYVHPDIVPVWRGIGDQLAADEPAADSYPDRIFCSRRLAKRACHNTDEVEEIFAAHGFAVVYPEEHSLAEQTHLFRAADVIGGFAGSGLFNLCLVTEPKQVILINSTAYTARNEYLIASLLGHSIADVTCVPDDPTFYQSPFRFNPDREGRFLASVLAGL